METTHTLNSKELKEIFFNRIDVFAVQTKKGGYFPIKREITLSDIDKHLKGEQTLGVYCLDKENKVKWACVDLDGTDLIELKSRGRIIYNLFKDYTRMLEFSGRRGYHIWIFFTTKVSAEYAKTLVKARLNRLDWANTEIFPKQTSLNENRLYGNLVKLPLGVHKGSGNRSVIIEYTKVK
jgi:hypothetical protein